MVHLVHNQFHSTLASHTLATLGINLSETLQVNVLHLVCAETAHYPDQCQIVKVNVPSRPAVTHSHTYQMKGNLFGVIMTSPLTPAEF